MNSSLRSIIAGRSASRWFARLRSSDFNEAADRAYRRWLASGRVEHEREFERRQLLWEMLGDLEADPDIAALVKTTTDGCSQRRRMARLRRRIGWSTAAVLAGLAAVIVFWHPTAPRTPSPVVNVEVYSTHAGEQRRVALKDGSEVELNTATALRVEYSNQVRRLVLEHGEAIFFVHHDTRRPFVVAAGDTSTRAVGTTFDILRLKDRTEIAVLEGRTQIETSAGQTSGRRVELRSGEGVTYTGQGLLSQVREADLTRIASWQKQRVELHDVTLEQAVEDFNRYTQYSVVIGDTTLKDLRVSGVFRFNDVGAFTKALHSSFGIRSEPNGDGVVLLRALGRPSQPVAR